MLTSLMSVWLMGWFLLICTEGKLDWEVEERITDYGQNLTLFCEVDNCCTQQSGWFTEFGTIYIDVKNLVDDPTKPYGGFVRSNGFGLVIKTLNKSDINVTYGCSYGFVFSDLKLLQYGDVFLEPENGNKHEDVIGKIIGCSVGGVIGIIIVVIVSIRYCRRSRNRPKAEEVIDRDVEMSLLQSQDDSTGVLEHEGITNHGFLTRILKAGMEALANHKIVLVTGMDGSGKSTTLKKLSELYYKEYKFSTLDLSWQTRSLIKTELNYFPNKDKLELYRENLLVLMDDFTSNGNLTYLIEDFDILRMVNKTKCQKPENVKIVLAVVDSCYECCRKELQNRKLLSDVVCINLNDDKFRMTDEEKGQLLKMYIPETESNSALYTNVFESFAATEDRIGFPELCYLFSKIPELRKGGENFFLCPNSSLKEYLIGLGNKQSPEDRIYYVALIHIMISGNLPIFGIHEQDIKHMKKIMELLYQKDKDMENPEEEDINMENPEDVIDEKNCGILTKTSEGRDGFYLFQNQLISNHIFYAFETVIHQVGFENILNVLSLEFIIERLRPHTFSTSDGHKVLEENLYPVVTETIINLIIENKRRFIDGQESVQKLCLSPLLCEMRFLESLLTYANNLDHYKDSNLKDENIGGYHGKFGFVKFYFSAVLLRSAVECHLDTEIVKIILKNISDTLNWDSPPEPNILEACHGTLIFAMGEECKANDLSRIKIFWKFILKHDIDYICNNFLANACDFHNKNIVHWILENIDIADDDVFKILQRHGYRFLNRDDSEDNFKWIIEELYPDEPTNRNKLYLFKAIVNECKNSIMTHSLNLVKYLWQTYEQKILNSYSACYPNDKKETVRNTVLDTFMEASLKGNWFPHDLIDWWIDKEGSQNFDKSRRKEIKDKYRVYGYTIPDHLKLS